MTTSSIKGLAELRRNMTQLPDKIQNSLMRGALRAGAKVILTQADDNISSSSGDLAASLRIGTKSKGRTVTATVTAGPSKKKHRGTFYARMVEGGTKAHIIKVRPPGRQLAIGVAQVEHPGAQAKPFLAPALDAKATAAVMAVREYIRSKLASKHGIDVPAPLEEGDE